MSYSVVCPSCNEKNIGSAFHCIKCQTSLIGVPRQENPLSQFDISTQQKITAKSQNEILEENKQLETESVGQAVWRSAQGTLVIILIAVLVTAIICWYGNWRTLYSFGNGLIYVGVVLLFISYYIFNGNQHLVREQKDPFNPMNTMMPGTHQERTRRYWLDFMDGINGAAMVGLASLLSIGLGWFLVSLVD